MGCSPGAACAVAATMPSKIIKVRMLSLIFIFIFLSLFT